MEHNFTFNSAAEITLIRDILAPIFNDYATYQAMRNIVSFGGMAMPAINAYSDVSIRELLDRLDNAITKAIEDENPKPENRYAIYEHNNPTSTYEYNDLKEAWKGYVTCYSDEAESGCRLDEGDYTLRDEWLELDITSEVPYLVLEYEWEADVSVRLNGSRVDFDDLSYDTRENIGSCISESDTYGTYTDEVGDISWEDVEDWEAEHDEHEQTSGDVCWDETVKEANTNAEEESTNA